MKRKTHTVRFFVWLIACFPLLAWASSPIYYVHSDHLGTPQKLSDDTGTVVWEAEYEPFGEATVNDDPDLDGNAVEFNLRFPGQYYDKYTGKNYNYYRDYDPSTGRYLQSDPIGLHGGLNTYGYAYQNPLFYADPYGLYCLTPDQIAAIAGAIGGGIGGIVTGASAGASTGPHGAIAGAIGGGISGAGAGFGAGSASGTVGNAAAGAVAGAPGGVPGMMLAAAGGAVSDSLGGGALGGAAGGALGGIGGAASIVGGAIGGLVGGMAEQFLTGNNDCDDNCDG